MSQLRDRGDIGIVACEAGEPLAKKVSDSLEKQFSKKQSKPANEYGLIRSTEVHFSNTEIKTIIDDSIRGRDVYIIQDVANSTLLYSVDENTRAARTAIDACWRADAHYVTVILPCFPYARQDRAIGRESFTAAQNARDLERTNAERVITLDIHNPTVGSVFDRTKFENLHARKNFIDYVKGHLDLENLIVVSPDLGATPRCQEYANRLQRNLAILWKRRDYSKPGSIEEMRLLGDVEGKDVLFVDDMLDTGGTAVKACQVVKDHGVRDVYFAVSLPLLNGQAKDKLARAYGDGILTKVIGTNAVYHGEDFAANSLWYEEVSVAGYIAKVIFNINHHKSLSKLLE